MQVIRSQRIRRAADILGNPSDAIGVPQGAFLAGEKVRFTTDVDEKGTVHHIGTFTQGSLRAGDTVDCTVDHDRRLINTRLHSAGHVIDMAVDALGLDWIATKGQHYPHLSAIEYTGAWQPDQEEALRQKIEDKANEFIAKGSDNTLKFMPVSEMHTVVRHVPDNIPTTKPARVVMYGENFGIPCGGTHLKNIHDIGQIRILKLRGKKGIIRLSYAVIGVNA